MTLPLPLPDLEIHYPPSACALTRRHLSAPTRLPTPIRHPTFVRRFS